MSIASSGRPMRRGICSVIMLAVVTGVMIMTPIAAAHAQPPNIPCVSTNPIDMAKCVANPGGTILNAAAGSAAKNAADSGVGQLASAMFTGWDQLMKSFLTSWMGAGLLIKLDGVSVPWLQAALKNVSVFLATLGLMFAGIWTMVHQRAEKAVQVAKAMFWVLLVSGAGTAFVQVLLPVGDAFGKWLLSQANINAKVAWNQTELVANFAGIAIIGGIIGILATLFQWGLMIVRAVVVPLMVAIWPTAAATSVIDGAGAAMPKVTQWLLAFILYKPAAAIVYAFAWQSKNEDGIKGLLNGLVLTVLAVFALPALVRLMAPAAAKLGSAAGGVMAISAAGSLAGAAASLVPAAGAGARAASGGAQQLGNAARNSGSGGSLGGGGGAGGPLADGSGPNSSGGGALADGSDPSSRSDPHTVGSSSGSAADDGASTSAGSGPQTPASAASAGGSASRSGAGGSVRGGSSSQPVPGSPARSTASGSGVGSPAAGGSAASGEGRLQPLTDPPPAGPSRVARGSTAVGGSSRSAAGSPPGQVGEPSRPTSSAARGSGSRSGDGGAGMRAARELSGDVSKKLASGAGALGEAIDGGDEK